MIFPNKKVIFLLPPKTGTSSFLKLIKNKSYKFKGAPPNRHSFLSELIIKQKLQKDIHDYKIYQLCRNPLDKLVSSFYFSKALPNIRAQYPKYIELSFEEVINQLKTPEKKQKQIPILFHGGGSRLYIPQTEWGDIECDITYIKLEDLKENTNILSEIFQDEFEDFPFINATHMRRKKPYLEMFNKETLKMAQELYKTDFETLQYEYESII